jgi:hypothetical protein
MCINSLVFKEVLRVTNREGASANNTVLGRTQNLEKQATTQNVAPSRFTRDGAPLRGIVTFHA